MSGNPPNLRVSGINHNLYDGAVVFRRDEALAFGGYALLHHAQTKELMAKFNVAGRTFKIADDALPCPGFICRWIHEDADGHTLSHISSIGNREDALERFASKNTDFGDGQPLTLGDLQPYWAAWEAFYKYGVTGNA